MEPKQPLTVMVERPLSEVIDEMTRDITSKLTYGSLFGGVPCIVSSEPETSIKHLVERKTLEAQCDILRDLKRKLGMKE